MSSPMHIKEALGTQHKLFSINHGFLEQVRLKSKFGRIRYTVKRKPLSLLEVSSGGSRVQY